MGTMIIWPLILVALVVGVIWFVWSPSYAGAGRSQLSRRSSALDILARCQPRYVGVPDASPVVLQNVTAKAAEMLKASCPADNPLARLAVVGKRLDTLLQAIKMVSSPLNDFYAALNDEQEA
jgi:hypothetical protein